MANAEVVAIGSELLLGQIVDTNSAWMAQRLTALGINLFYKTIVGDNPKRMKEVLIRALERSDLVITSGGLGPTQDDLTREMVAEVTGRKLVLDPHLLEQLDQRFRSRGFIMTPNNEKQAYIPEGATPVENPNGSAPSFIVEDSRGVIFVLPGVPFELKWLFDNEVVPYVRRKFDLSEIITYRVLKVAELGESRVDDLIGHLIANSSNPTVGVLAHPGQVDVRIAAKAANVEEAMKLIAPVETEARQLLGGHIFAVDNETMEDAIGKLLREKDRTIAVCEDLTGGLLVERLQQAGSEHFVEGIIINGQTSIRRLLAFSRQPDCVDELLQEPVTLTNELAWAVRAQAESDLGLALHAVADPNDRAENLARGQTFISITDGAACKTRTYNLAGRGRPDRTRMSFNAMELARLALLEGIE
jgi:nicotinamide-nucleotide amidase